jgi:hypothetical protein
MMTSTFIESVCTYIRIRYGTLSLYGFSSYGTDTAQISIGFHFTHQIIVVPNFMVQLGCPFAKNPHVMYGTLDEDAGLGSGPPDTTFKACNGKEHTRDEDGNIEDEFIKGGMSNLEGTLAMANSGEPDSGGSQVRNILCTT